MYRIRPAGGDVLAYIGQTGRSLRERLSSLCRHALSPVMPFNDPHTAAPSLWAIRHSEGVDFECSAASAGTPKRLREGLECYLLWKYRQERGESTLCNHGRFHALYYKSGPRSSNRRGGLLAGGMSNPAGGASLPALPFTGSPPDRDWMGLGWSPLKTLDSVGVSSAPRLPGLYKLLSQAGDELLYVGQSMDLKARLMAHRRVDWGVPPTAFSYAALDGSVLPYQLKELENDLIAGFYRRTRDVPSFQFSNSHKGLSSASQ